MEQIRIRGARTHNLKNINLDLPRNKLTVITGLSGSGKSSLAFDTLYAEGQRRYVESLSAYARQFLQLMEKPDVDLIEGLSPAISIEQKATSHNPRSTVGTVTEIHDYLRLLYARVGTPYCPDHSEHPLAAQTVSQMVDAVLAMEEGTKLMILAPVVANRKGEHADLFASMQAQGFVRFRIQSGTHAAKIYEIDDLPKLKKTEKHTIDVVIDRVKVNAEIKQRLAETFETALRLADGRAVALEMDGGAEHVYSNKFACNVCGYSLQELEPRLFSFNNPMGACPECDGLGHIEFFDPKRIVAFPNLSLASGAIKGWDRRNQFYFQMLSNLAAYYDFDIDKPFEQLPEAAQKAVLYGSGKTSIPFTYVNERGRTVIREHTFEGVVTNLQRRYRETDSMAVKEELSKFINEKQCPSCDGARLRVEARYVKLGAGKQQRAIYEVANKPLRDCLAYFEKLTLKGAKKDIADRVIKEIISRLKFLNNVGLDYLSLDRSADTLSGGEAQRIRLASQIGSGLTGVMYVLDEPSIGLHQRDNDRLIETLKHLRDIGNTRAGGRARRRRDPHRRLHRRHGSGRGRAWRPGDRRRHAGADPEEQEIAHREVPERHAEDRGAEEAPRGQSGQAAGDHRRHRQQPEEGVAEPAGRPDDLRDRRVRFGQVVAGERHAVPGAVAPPVRLADRAGAARFDQRPGTLRQGDLGRPGADRPHPAFEPGHLHRPVHADPRLVLDGADGEGARLQRRTLLVQRQGRALRGVPGRRRDQGRDALPAGRVRAVRCLPRQALQPRDARSAVQGQEHHRSAGPDGGRRARVLQAGAGHRAQAADAARRGPRLHQAGPERDHAVGRRGAAGQAVARAVQARHGPHAVHPRRADHRPALPGHRLAAEGDPSPARPGQYAGRSSSTTST